MKVNTIVRNLQTLQERVAAAAGRSGRSESDVELIAVTKTRSVDEIEAALDAGITHLGENRVQEALQKKASVSTGATWHLVGHLQSNKAGKAAELFDVVQSLDNPRAAAALDRRAAQLGRQLQVMLQVNSSGAAEQFGLAPEGVGPLAEKIAELPALRAVGLMTIAAQTRDETELRGCFAMVRRLAEDLSALHIDNVDMRYLSMGMSGDFEIAIEEGASMIRIGTALFGPRSG